MSDSATTEAPRPDVAETPRTAVVRMEIDRDAFAAQAADDATRAAGDAETRVPVSFSSEYGVERFDYWEGKKYLEILDHSPGAIDLSRAARGLPFVDTHNIYSVGAVLGRIEDVRLRADGKLAGMLRFSQRAEAQDYRRDLLDGIAGEVSVGYRIDPERVDVITGDGQMTRYIVRRWTPHEVSAVPVPADPTVGANRALNGSAPIGSLPCPVPRADAVVSARALAATTDHRTDAQTGQEPTMDPVSTAPDSGGNTTVVVNRSEAPDQETLRRALAEQARQHDVNDVFSRGIADGKPLNEIGAAMMTALRERAERGPQFGAPVSLSDKEQKRYSVARAILAATTGEKCFESDVSEQIQRNLPQGYSSKGTGVFIPTNLAVVPSEGQRAAIVAGTGTIGGNLTFTVPGSFIDLLRNQTVVLRAGATLLPGLRSSVSFPKQTGAGTFYWVGENSGSDVTESNLTFGLVSLTPKTGAATQAFSRQLLVQAEFVPEVEMMVRNDLAAIHARAIDLAALAGLGSSNQPLGLLASTSIGTVTLGANGAVPTYDHLVDMETAVYNGNIDGVLKYITTPGIAGKLKKTQKFATTNGEAVWAGGLTDGNANGARAFGTKQIPSNYTKGTATTVCHGIISGIFENLIIGEFGAAEIITDELSKKKQGLIEVTSFQMVDVCWRYDEAFQVTKDARTS